MFRQIKKYNFILMFFILNDFLKIIYFFIIPLKLSTQVHQLPIIYTITGK